ncbi:MAG: hypothetical protein HKN41_06760 [Ilumatobacter sp.]|nr:hypothetical protein [Ilumatobacter sp.]
MTMWRLGAIVACCVTAACGGGAVPATDDGTVVPGAPSEAPMGGAETIAVTDDVMVIVDGEVDP